MSIVRLEEPASARDWCAEVRNAGGTVGFVPTMGALHDGHLELVARAVRENDAACVSVFVNPLQFDEATDFEAYPRDFGADAERLAGVGCAMVFTGTLAGFFPESVASGSEGDGTGAEHDPWRSITVRDPGPAAAGLEGSSRTGHFEGVATIVRRLFELVRPARAYFGAKDFQQTLVVRHVARVLADEGEPAPRVVVCPTSREADGLARSSRNLLLSPDARALAPTLHAALSAARAAWARGERSADALRAELVRVLDVPGITFDYAEVRDPERWTADAPTGNLERARALVAARIGGVRLIDNLALEGDDA